MAAVLYLKVVLELAAVPYIYASSSTPREVDCSRLCILNETCHRYWSSVSRDRSPRSVNTAVSTTTTTTTAPTTTSNPITITTTTADKDLCPTVDGYVSVRNPRLCFKLSIKSDARPYAEAKSVCDKNGRLISLDTAEKYNCIDKHVTDLGIAAYDSDAEHVRIWVGLKRNTANIFHWSAGGSYVHEWAPDEPDLHVSQRCGQLTKAGLSDMWCSKARRYICEIPMAKPAEVLKP